MRIVEPKNVKTNPKRLILDVNSVKVNSKDSWVVHHIIKYDIDLYK
jgi:hypothetical protein